MASPISEKMRFILVCGCLSPIAKILLAALSREYRGSLQQI